MAIITLIYCGVVISHVFFSYYLCDKIIVYIKKRLVKKIPRIKVNYQQKQAFNNLVNDARTFSDWVVYAPNQLYYITLETIVAF
jgi:hypothetical protein